MCDFCNYRKSAKGAVIGKAIAISECANATDLTECQLYKSKNDKSFSVIIFSYGVAEGYFEINFCPICGRDLRSEENDKD